MAAAMHSSSVIFHSGREQWSLTLDWSLAVWRCPPRQPWSGAPVQSQQGQQGHQKGTVQSRQRITSQLDNKTSTCFWLNEQEACVSAWSRWLELDREVQVVVRSAIGGENIMFWRLTWYKANTFQETVRNFGQRISFASKYKMWKFCNLFSHCC